MKLSRRIAQGTLLVLALSLTAMLAVGLYKGKTQKETRPAPGPEAPEAEMKLTDIEFTEMQQGKRFWTLGASEALYFQDEQKTLLTSVRLTFFLDSGEEIVLESSSGVLHAGTKNIELWDAVHAALPRGYELTTQRAAYDHEQRLVYSDTAIRLNGPGVEFEGNSWKFRIPERQAVVEGGVRGSLVLAPLSGNLSR
jgi:LPS export ABC transporter protein LptC